MLDLMILFPGEHEPKLFLQRKRKRIISKGIEIPAVLVSHATGERLWSNRSWIPGRQGKLVASVGATGHIVLQPRPVGALEMLGIYLLLSVLLLAFSGVCGLLFALAFTW